MSIIALNESVNTLVFESANTSAAPSETGSKRSDRLKAPDGGYSWVILIAVFVRIPARFSSRRIKNPQLNLLSFILPRCWTLYLTDACTRSESFCPKSKRTTIFHRVQAISSSASIPASFIAVVSSRCFGSSSLTAWTLLHMFLQQVWLHTRSWINSVVELLSWSVQRLQL